MSETECRRSIIDSQHLPATVERVFRSLVSPSEIQLWWQAKTAIIIPRVGGVWCANWGKDADDPEYVVAANILEFVPSRILTLGEYRYYSKSGEVAGLTDIQTKFELSPDPQQSGQCMLKVTQSGFPPSGNDGTDAYFNDCVIGWRSTLGSLSDYFGGESTS